jgi:trk system potassium uptake protein TrkA
LIATTGNDNVNLMIAQVPGKVLGVRRVIARVFEPRKEKVCRKLGIETVCPTVIAGDELLRSVGCGAGQGRHVGHEGEEI